MGSLTPERLYELLPALYRIADPAEGEPLKALIALFAREFAALEENVDQLYDDQFIETCAEWVTPYIGDLIGYRPLHGASPRISSPRAEVANTIGFRRRKGTISMLEELAHDVTDWPAHAVEFFPELATTQYMKHRRLDAPATANLRDLPSMLGIDGPFNQVPHLAEMRRPEAGSGRYNIPNIGIFLWRLLPIRLSNIPLVAEPGDASGRKYRVNPLGSDLRLFREGRTDDDISSQVQPIDVPEPLSVRKMALAVKAAQAILPEESTDDDYGPGDSIVLFQGASQVPVPVSQISICDLRDIVDSLGNVIGWNHEKRIAGGNVGLDPERGRVLLGASVKGPLFSTFHYAQARTIGGGEYAREPEGDELAIQSEVKDSDPLQPQLNAIAGGGRLTIADSLTYTQKPTFKATGSLVVVAAGQQARPLVASSGDMKISIEGGGRLVIDGLVFSGGALLVPAAAGDEARELVLRDCTLVPGRTLKLDGSPASPGSVSLRIEDPFTKVTVERCITGAIQAVSDTEIAVTDSVIDACDPTGVAFEGLKAGDPGAQLTLENSTIVGKVHAKAFELVSNSIFFSALASSGDSWAGPLIAQRSQQGCIRFSFVPTGSITPRRFKCVPDSDHPMVGPSFTSLRYGDPGYCQLRSATDKSIREGADNGSEMGVLSPLMQPLREINLKIRLDEYLRFGLHAGIFWAT